MSEITAYLSEIRKNLDQGDATEHTHRPALKTLMEGLFQGVTATNEPKRIACGAPDFLLSKKNVLLGHIKTKDIGTDLDEIELGKGAHGDQFVRYRNGLSNWILTDYLDFRWYVGGQKRLQVCIADLDHKGKLKPLVGSEPQLVELLGAFINQLSYTSTVTSSPRPEVIIGQRQV
jgi:hypothetical protein